MVINIISGDLIALSVVSCIELTTIMYAGLHWMNSTCTVLNGIVSRYNTDTNNDVNKEIFKEGEKDAGFSLLVIVASQANKFFTFLAPTTLTIIVQCPCIIIAGENFRHGQFETALYELSEGQSNGVLWSRRCAH